MQYKALGRTGFEVSSVSFGAWAIGGTWGQVDDAEAMRCLHRALDLGVNFFDTADVYGDGHSERLLARLRRERRDPFWVATKIGRRSNPHVKESYNRENLTQYVERCLKNLEVAALDLVQIHCPPTDVYYMPEVFGLLDDLVKAGKVRFYGASIERVECERQTPDGSIDCTLLRHCLAPHQKVLRRQIFRQRTLRAARPHSQRLADDLPSCFRGLCMTDQ